MDAALAGVDPLIRAELAANRGEGEKALYEIGRTFSAAVDMSSAELEFAADWVAHIATILEVKSPQHAKDARMFAEGLRHFGQWH